MTPIAIILLTLGGALLFEGLIWALAPEAARRAYEQIMAQFDDRALANMGLISLIIGALLIIAAVLMGR